MKMKYAAIVTYTTDVRVGVIVKADDLADAWAKLLKKFDGGESVRSVDMAMVIGPEFEIK